MTKVKEVLAKRTIYDSVFTDLFKIPEYTLQLYQALHLEDAAMTEEQIQIVTLENLLLIQQYNDLGFMAGLRRRLWRRSGSAVKRRLWIS